MFRKLGLFFLNRSFNAKIRFVVSLIIISLHYYFLRRANRTVELYIVQSKLDFSILLALNPEHFPLFPPEDIFVNNSEPVWYFLLLLLGLAFFAMLLYFMQSEQLKKKIDRFFTVLLKQKFKPYIFITLSSCLLAVRLYFLELGQKALELKLLKKRYDFFRVNLLEIKDLDPSLFFLPVETIMRDDPLCTELGFILFLAGIVLFLANIVLFIFICKRFKGGPGGPSGD